MFFGNSMGSVQVSLLGNFTSQTGGASDGINYFGWYTIQADGTLGTTTRLLSAATPVNTSAIFSPGGNYGFFIENVKGSGEPFEGDSGALAFCSLLAATRRSPVSRRRSPIA